MIFFFRADSYNSRATRLNFQRGETKRRVSNDRFAGGGRAANEEFNVVDDIGRRTPAGPTPNVRLLLRCVYVRRFSRYRQAHNVIVDDLTEYRVPRAFMCGYARYYTTATRSAFPVNGGIWFRGSLIELPRTWEPKSTTSLSVRNDETVNCSGNLIFGRGTFPIIVVHVYWVPEYVSIKSNSTSFTRS